jgi:uncharacterized protein (UPF0212 family)
MTNEEAIKILEYSICPDDTGKDCGAYTCEECREAHMIGIIALEKQIPKKPLMFDDCDYNYYCCPNCGLKLEIDVKHCNCGQAIDWSEEE